MAKVEVDCGGVKVTVITSHSSAVGTFKLEGKYYTSKIPDKLITNDDVAILLNGAADLIEQKLKKPVSLTILKSTLTVPLELVNSNQNIMPPNSSTEENEMLEENNVFYLKNFIEGTEGQKVVFYKLNKDGSSENGTTLEAMIAVTKDRLKDLNNRFPCKENEEALEHLGKALDCLIARTKDREERGVEGKHEA